MKVTQRPIPLPKGNQGVAIVIVLSFVVLLTGLVVAFFTRATTQRQVANAALKQNQVDLLAQNALSIIVGDLKDEIRTGSENLTTNTTIKAPAGDDDIPDEAIYYPKLPTDAVPKRSGNPSGNTNPNLIRRSWYGDDHFASNSSSITASSNQRKVSLLRWNAHGLIPPASGTDLTPAANTFTAPDWVLVTKLGPKVFASWNNDDGLNDSTENNYVTGRYAYAIYDEGGLLDINLAGYPTKTSDDELAEYRTKPAVAYADLTMLAESASPPSNKPSLTTTDIDALIAWRNYATTSNNSLTDGHLTFHEMVVNNRDGFLKIPSKEFGTDEQTDQAFTSRQSLIKFWKNKFPTKLHILQYLATFTRGLNQPSYQHQTTEPGRTTAVTKVNPNILEERNTANGLLPLVRQRFPLSRLAWLTSEGPSAGLSGTTGKAGTILSLLTNTDPEKGYGVSLSFLQEGTADNIRDYFGLVWNAGKWDYVHGTGGAILTLEEVAALTGTNKRAPNFFELLKAGINTHALGISITGTPSATEDALKDVQIFQIGANVIDQADVDSFPSVINTGGGVEVYGVENLPYLYRVRNTLVRVTEPNPDPDQADAEREDIPNGDPANPVLKDQGQAVVLLQPEIWNPHRALKDKRSELAFTGGLTPTKFRFHANTTTPRVVKLIATAYNDEPSAVTDSISLTSASSYVDFGIADSITGTTTFREPTLLKYKTSPGDPKMGGTAFGTATSLAGVDEEEGFTDINDATAGYMGVYLGAMPLRWVWQDSHGTDMILSAAKASAEFTDTGDVEFALEYQDGTGSTGAWKPYDRKPSPEDIISSTGIQSLTWKAKDSSVNPTSNTESWATTIDPRTSRFGMFAGRSTAATSPLPPVNNTTSITKTDQGAPQTDSGVDVSSHFTPPATWKKGGTGTWLGFLQQNIVTTATEHLYYPDLDNVVRRASNAVNDADGDGRPMKADNEEARPAVLNRPLHSVAELGYVFSDTPWKNLDMSTTESAYAALLDLFCINENSDDPDGLVAGKVNLNTRQHVVLKSVLKGAYTREPFVISSGADPKDELDATLAAKIAEELYKKTNTGTTPEPLVNLAELVGGRWKTGSSGTPIDGKTAYTGFSSVLDLSGTYTSGFELLQLIPNYKEATIRALANVGETRVWNLLIDIIAQSGRYRMNATQLEHFNVEAERRYWVHIAIDRATGKILDQKIEIVKE
ncbi:MAG TPA: hypothetical protein VNQ90_00280 [Chthoniobacteraceae bacterium]|nr:hypothetical protein [Chthoniobacteraceae bacterium]